jgi:ankyrin repeat protein
MCSWRPLSPFELVIAVTQDPESDFTIDDDVDIDYVLSACQNFVVVADGQPNRHSTHAEAPATNSPRAERSHLPDGGYKAVNVSDAKEAEISSRLKSHLRSSVCRFSHLSVREYLETHHWTVSEANTFAACICLRTLLCLQLDGAPGIEFSDADEVLDGTTPILKVVRLERSSRQQLIWIDADGQGSKMGVPESNARIFVEDNESKFRPPPFLCFVEFVPDETADHSSSASSRGFDTYIKGHRGTALEAWVEYAASTWSLHTRRATTIKKTDPTLDPLVLQFLGDPGAASAQYHAWSIFNHRALDLSMEQPELLGQFHRKTFNQLALCPTTSTDFGCAYLGLGTILRSRLEAGLTDVNEPNELGDSLLLLAARGSHYETCAALLSHGANPNYFDNGEVTPLQYAAKNKRDDLVNLLLDHNADPNLVAKEITAYTRTPLIEVVSRGQIDTVRRLLERGADVTLGKGDDMYRAIEIAATRGDREIVALLLNKYSTVDERTTDLHIWEALLAACASKNPNSTAVIELLINRVNPADTTAMHSAAVNRNLEAAKALSDLGVGVDIRAPTWTWSGKYKYNAMIERQRAMIMVAAGEQHIPPVSSSEFWEEGDTPLLALLKHHKKEGRLEVATQLIAWGADVNVQDFWGRTPLRLAIETGDGNMEKMVEHLLSKEADPEIKDRAGVSALQAAQSTREPNRKLIEMLGGDHGVDEASVELVGEVPSAAT